MAKQRTHRDSHLRVGRRDVEPDAPAHVRGVHEGNEPGRLQRGSGIEFFDNWARGSARRSTGINAADRDPIDPNSPNLSPA